MYDVHLCIYIYIHIYIHYIINHTYVLNIHITWVSNAKQIKGCTSKRPQTVWGVGSQMRQIETTSSIEH